MSALPPDFNGRFDFTGRPGGGPPRPADGAGLPARSRPIFPGHESAVDAWLSPSREASSPSSSLTVQKPQKYPRLDSFEEEDGAEGAPGRFPKRPTVPEALEMNAKVARVLEATGDPELAAVAGRVRSCMTRSERSEHAYPNPTCAVSDTVRPWFCSERVWCVVCARRAAVERGREVAGTFLAIGQALRARGIEPRLVDVEFTVPQEARHLVPYARHGEFVRACYSALEDAYEAAYARALLRQGVSIEDVQEEAAGAFALGAHAIVHQASSSRPWKEHPHVHVLLPNAAFPRSASEAPGELAFYFAEDATEDRAWRGAPTLEDLRDLARRRLCAEFGPEFEALQVVNVSFVPLLDEDGELSERAAFKAYYNTRAHVLDVAKGLREVDRRARTVRFVVEDKTEGRLLSETVSLGEFARGVVDALQPPTGYHKSRWLGWLANRGRDDRELWLGVVRLDEFHDALSRFEGPDSDPARRPERGVCACCGVSLVPAESVSTAAFLRERDMLRVYILGFSTPDDFDIDKRAARARLEYDRQAARRRATV